MGFPILRRHVPGGVFLCVYIDKMWKWWYNNTARTFLGGLIMYDNIGSKIKGLAKALFIIEAIWTIISGIVLLCIDDRNNAFLAVFLFIGGPIFAWISSWLLYGFGELIDKVCEIATNTRENEYSATAPKGELITKPSESVHVNTTCPECGKKVSGVQNSFLRGTDTTVCPHCGTMFKFK